MLGAIIGDIVGSTYEFQNTKEYNFELFPKGSDFTDDTVCTIAVAAAVLNEVGYETSIRYWCKKHPHPKGAYGGSFAKWLSTLNPKPYGSYGNGRDKAQISKTVQELYGYDLSHTCDEIRETNTFNETCQVTVPQAIVCFLESYDFESAIRLAVSIGGDSDTIAAITAGIAEAFYGIPEELAEKGESYLTKEMKHILWLFRKRVGSSSTEVAMGEETMRRRERYRFLRNRFSELFLEKENILQHEEPLLTAIYLSKIEHKQFEQFRLSIELQELKLRFSLLQAYINRNEAPDLKAVDREVKRQFEAYYRQIETEAEKLAAAGRFLASDFLSAEDSKKLKELYYFIVKRLHPDLNPEQTERMKELFLKAQAAYELGDLQLYSRLYCCWIATTSTMTTT